MMPWPGLEIMALALVLMVLALSTSQITVWEFLNFLTFPSPGSKFASAYQISSYSDDLQLRYVDITIFKMAAVRHVGFSKFEISSPNLCMRAIMPPYSKFRLNRTIWSRVVAKK